jgi:hypothetical protein
MPPTKHATLKSESPHEKQHNQDDQDNSDDANAPVTVAVSIAANDATKAAEQQDDQDDDKYQANRHNFPPIAEIVETTAGNRRGRTQIKAAPGDLAIS